MTLNEIDQYIKTLNRAPGQYTSEEIYNICKMYRQLPKKCKSWKDLARKIGWTKSISYLSKLVWKVDHGVLNISNIDSLNTVNMDLDNNYSDNARFELNELEIAKMQYRDSKRAFRNDLRQEARKRTFENQLIEAINKLPELPKLPSIDYGKELLNTSPWQREGVLLLSDLHLGAVCNNSYNTYNLKVASERLEKLAMNTILYCKTMNVTKLNIINLGDMIHGLIHVTARLEQELDTVDQIMKAAELISQTLHLIESADINITYRSVTDNHSRMVANIKENLEQDNANRLIDEFIKLRLKDSSIKFIDDDNIDVGILKFKLDNGKICMASHGHQDKKSSAMQDMVGLTREYVDYIFMGHYHNPAEHSFQGTELFVNGSIIGTEQYAYSHRLFSHASQKLLVFDVTDNVININIDLQ